MKLIFALCAVVLIASFESVNGDNKGSKSPTRAPSKNFSRSPSRPRSRASGTESPFVAGGKLSGFRPQGPYKQKAIDVNKRKRGAQVKLGIYDSRTLKKAQAQFENIDSQELENGLLKTDLFKDMVADTKKEFAGKGMSEKQINDKIRGRVVRKLTRMEHMYEKAKAEQLLIRALLDKGFGTDIAKATKFEKIQF